ncbi:MAG: YbaB/EbfC family nucleoid-associated protein, partial [Gammaproteobacteria bacterium]|nr:YbaB/EbfC family nucleoid-associated protein [Gammaproteobacteria bacterium]
MSEASMQQLMEQAKKMQDQMKQAQARIEQLRVIGEAGGGLVKITFNGLHQAIDVYVSPTLIGEEEEMIADLVKAAINSAVQKIEAAIKEEMGRVA